MIVISEALQLTLIEALDANRPVILYANMATIDNLSATSEDGDYPVTNLANPSTTSLQGWRSASTATQYVTVDLQATEDVDALAVARHNFGSAQIIVSVEGTVDGSTWSELVEETMLADDAPALFRFVKQGLLQVRLKLQPSSTAPRAAVLFAGTLLVFEKGVQASTPLPQSRSRQIVTGEAENGDYLGRIVRTSSLVGQVSIINLSSAWYETYCDPFFAASAETPFFFAWAPQQHPDQVAYAWLTNDPVPTTALNGKKSIQLAMKGIA